MFTFDSDQDWGPYKTLFDVFRGYNARLRVSGADFEVEIICGCNAHVEIRHWNDGDEDEATGSEEQVRYEDITAVTIY